MRVVLCTSGGHPGQAVLDALLGSARIRIAAIVLSTRVFGPRCGILGGSWRHFRASGLQYALYLGRAAAPRLRAPGVPVIRCRNLNEAPVRDAIAGFAPDLLLSAFFNQVIGAPVAGAARLGALNIHPSPLPELKGVDPVFYARLRGDASLAVSLHRITAELDAGNLIAQRSLPVQPSESVLAGTTRLYGAGATLLLEQLDAIEAGAQGSPQPGPGSYFSWPSRAQVAELRRRGVRLV